MISSQKSHDLRIRSCKIGRRFDEKVTDNFDLLVFPLGIEFFNDLAGLLEPCWKVSPSQVDQKS